jgi:ubiquinone/menaquinone biosynthesis C-methylase UbiE
VKKITNELEILAALESFKDKTVIDVGCGTGGMTRELALHGAKVTGIDTKGMLEKAKAASPMGVETYVPGGGEALPFEDSIADVILYFASLHHIPVGKMETALKEAHRVLKPGGVVICLEPVGREGSFFDIIRLVEDEREMQMLAYEAINMAGDFGLRNNEEYMVYIERSYEDYVSLLNKFVDDDVKRSDCLVQAREITERFSRETGVAFEDFRFKSICRVNVLVKE